MTRFPAFVLAVAVLSAASPALACRCASPASPAAHLARSDVAFVGRVLSTRADGELGRVTTFAVAEAWKGRPPRTVQVRHSADVCCVCGVEFRPGVRQLIFAHRSEAGLATSSCEAARFPEAAYRAAAGR